MRVQPWSLSFWCIAFNMCITRGFFHKFTHENSRSLTEDPWYWLTTATHRWRWQYLGSTLQQHTSCCKYYDGKGIPYGYVTKRILLLRCVYALLHQYYWYITFLDQFELLQGCTCSCSPVASSNSTWLPRTLKIGRCASERNLFSLFPHLV